MTDSTTPPGWPFLIVAVVLIYGPKLLVDAAFYVIDRIRAVDDNLADFGSECDV